MLFDELGREGPYPRNLHQLQVIVDLLAHVLSVSRRLLYRIFVTIDEVSQ